LKKQSEIPTGLKNILNDRKSGSNLLLEKLIRFFVDNLNDISYLKPFMPLMKKEFAPFAGIVNFLKGLEKQNSAESVKEYLLREMDSGEMIYRRIYKKLSPLVKSHKRILTLSNSTTVLKVISLLKNENKSLTVFAAESRPKLEGRVMAKQLAAEKIKVELITDSMLPAFIEKCDSVIIGTDQILGSGNIVNKTGSRNAAILCKEFNKPFYVIADKKKKTSAVKYKPVNRPAQEVWKVKDTRIKVHNFYFEEVEKKYITKVITD
jgi:translation initiation factor 2B subunit (eIF-2B alpha/beta/delta family)